MIDPQEALAIGAQVVDDLENGLPFWKRSASPERTQAALDVARFLAEYSVEEVADEQPADGPIDMRQAVSVGPARKVECAAEAGDFAYCRPGKSQGTPFVGLEVCADGERAHVVLTLTEARAFAAGILDAADEAEGGSPMLHFVKPEA